MCITSKCVTLDYHVKRCPPTDGKSVSLYPVILARFTLFRMCLSTYEECASIVSALHSTTMLKIVRPPRRKGMNLSRQSRSFQAFHDVPFYPRMMCINSKCATLDYHVERCPPTDGKSVSLYPVILARFTLFRMCLSTYEECASIVSALHSTTML